MSPNTNVTTHRPRDRLVATTKTSGWVTVRCTTKPPAVYPGDERNRTDVKLGTPR